MPNIDKIRVDNVDYNVVGSAESLPVGSEIDYDGNTVPTGWQEIDDPSVYSTTEQRIGTWIDGKPLYRKVYSFPSIRTSSVWTSPLPQNIDKVINLKGICYAGIYAQPLSLVNSGDIRFQAGLFTDSSNVGVDTGSNRSLDSGYIILEYTKTTD